MNNSVFIGPELPQVTELKARLATVEAERDAALKRAAEARETADNYAGHCNKACKQLEAVEAERDAARAGVARLRAEVERLREHEARARWCEQVKAQVSWSIINQAWRVLWYSEACELRQTSHVDRNAAIDAARGKV